MVSAVVPILTTRQSPHGSVAFFFSNTLFLAWHYFAIINVHLLTINIKLLVLYDPTEVVCNFMFPDIPHEAHAHLLNVHAISHSFINATFDLGVLCFACSSHGIRDFGYAYRHSFKNMFSLSTSSTSGRKRLSNILSNIYNFFSLSCQI